MEQYLCQVHNLDNKVIHCITQSQDFLFRFTMVKLELELVNNVYKL